MTNDEAVFVLSCVEAHGLAEEARKLAVKALKDSKPKEWIPCDEKLPETKMTCLCTLKSGAVRVLRYMWCGDRFAWFDIVEYLCLLETTDSITAFKRAHYDSFVIAWMPLPKPYKETRRDEK